MLIISPKSISHGKICLNETATAVLYVMFFLDATDDPIKSRNKAGGEGNGKGKVDEKFEEGNDYAVVLVDYGVVIDFVPIAYDM